MKRKIFSILAAALVLSLSVIGTSAAASAHCGGKHKNYVRNKTCNSNICRHADSDNDGFCDTCNSKYGSKCRYVDSDNDGICDNCDSRHSKKCIHTDSDNDNICDDCSRRIKKKNKSHCNTTYWQGHCKSHH